MHLDYNSKNWLWNLILKCFVFDVHSSKLFLKSRTLASILFLLVVRIIDGKYREAFRLPGLCVSDVLLSSEERQLVKLLNEGL